MADTGTDITVLNSLIKTINDSIQGYQESAKDIGNQRLASMFQDRAMERQKVATMLQAEVGRLGGDPSDGGSILGSVHQIFLDMKSAITGKDDDAILAEVQRGTFRQDLYYRVSGWTCQLPALRERREDIVPLAQHFFAQLRGPRQVVDKQVYDFLLLRDYPGNYSAHLEALERERADAASDASRAAKAPATPTPPPPAAAPSSATVPKAKTQCATGR